jgi:hypothetical protein
VKGDIEPVEKVIWSWARVQQYWKDSLFSGLWIGLLVVSGIFILSIASVLLTTVYPAITVSGFNMPLFSLVVDGIIIAPGSVLLLVIQSGWTSESFDEEAVVRPGESIQRSGRHGLIVGLIYGSISGVMIAFLFLNPLDGLLDGWLIGLATGLLNGGIVWIKHMLLRWRLWRNDSIPWHCRRFLDSVVERMFLLKVRGGYQFSHQLLLKHFATSDLSVLLDPKQGRAIENEVFDLS